MKIQSFGQWLPYWVTRTVRTQTGLLPVLIMKDGAMCVGLEVHAPDTFCAPQATLNAMAFTVHDALNTLPPKGYLQAIYESGFSFAELVQRYRDTVAEPGSELLSRLRSARAEMLAQDPSLTRTRIVYYVGLRDALGRLKTHKTSPRRSLFGLSKHPTHITRDDVRRAAEELAHSAQQVRDVLSGANLLTTLLSEVQLLAECDRAINPISSSDAAPLVQIETRDDLERCTRGKRALWRGPNLASQLPLGPLVREPNHLELDDPRALVRVLGFGRLPVSTDPETLPPFQYKHLPDCPMRLSVTHVATDEQLSQEELQAKRNRVHAQMGEGVTTNHAAEAAYHDFESLLGELANSTTRVFETSLHVALAATTSSELEDATREVKKAFRLAGAAGITLTHHQWHGWAATLPGNGYRSEDAYPKVTLSAAHLTPSFLPSTGAEKQPDFLFGNRQRGLRALTWRPHKGVDDRNTFVIGAMGSGKTFFMSHLIKTTLALGGHVVVADTKGPSNSTYRPLAELLGGEYFALSTDGEIRLNLCPSLPSRPLGPQHFPEQFEFLRDILLLITVPNLERNTNQDLLRSVATRAVLKTYEKATATPILSDIVRAIGELALADEEGVAAQEMAQRLQLWCDNPKRGPLLNRPAPVENTLTPFRVYDFFGLGKDPALSAVLISALAAKVMEIMSQLPRHVPKLFIFDESWAFFDYSELATRVVETLARVVRSYGAVCLFASQSHRDVVEGRVAKALLATTSVRVLLKHHAEHQAVAEAFNLSERELGLFRNLQFRGGHYAEMLVLDAHDSSSALLRYTPTPYEMWIDTSRPSDGELRRRLVARWGAAKALEYLAATYPHGAEPGDVLRELRRLETNETA